MVPRQFIALLKRARENRLLQEFGPALIVSAIVGRGSKDPPDPRTFMPSYGHVATKKPEMDWKRKMTELRGALEGLGAS